MVVWKAWTITYNNENDLDNDNGKMRVSMRIVKLSINHQFGWNCFFGGENVVNANTGMNMRWKIAMAVMRGVGGKTRGGFGCGVMVVSRACAFAISIMRINTPNE